MSREDILDIQKDIVVFLLFSKDAANSQSQTFMGFSEEIKKVLASEGGLSLDAQKFLHKYFAHALDMLNEGKLYDFEDAQMLLVKLFASDEITEAFIALSQQASEEKRQSCCHRIAELLHLARLRAALNPKLVPKTDLPKP